MTSAGMKRHVGEPTRISLAQESILCQKFIPNKRLALPRLGPSDIHMMAGLLAGVPPAIRERLGRNLYPGLSFPYPVFSQAEPGLQPRRLNLVRLESARWRVTLCPDLGGRMLGLRDKKLNRELLWQTPVMRQAPIALHGAWFLGGLEFNAFRLGHNVNGHSTVLTEQIELAGGVTGVRVGAMDELFGGSWTATIALLPDRVAIRVKLENHSAEPLPGYWWTNIAVPMNRRTRLMYAPGPVLHHGMFRPGFQDEIWPRLRGGDWQYWQGQPEIISAYFYQYGQDVFGYADRRDNWAMVHHADHRICRGRKLWSLGSGHDHAIWWDRLAEFGLDGYCEIQSGRLPTQLEADLIAPGQTIEWTESITGLTWDGGPEDYTAAFAEYARSATQTLAGNTAVQGKKFWLPRKTTVLVPAEPRLAVSWKVIQVPASLTAKEIADTVKRGPVAGKAWIKVLQGEEKAGPVAPELKLALAGALLDDGQRQEAKTRLTALRREPGAVGGYAAWLLALALRKQGWKATMVPLLREATAKLPNEPESWLAWHQFLLDSGKLQDAAALWKKIPRHLHTTDSGRFAQAQRAFFQGCWQTVHDLLGKPLLSVGEGFGDAWFLFKEAGLAEAIELYRRGDADSAQTRLAKACEAMPQFGIGRSEAEKNVDLMYYRWRLAKLAGQELVADALAGQLLRQWLPPGTPDAAYILRLARELKDPSAGRRLKLIQAWNKLAGPAWQKDLPLRAALLQTTLKNSPQGWRVVARQPLYRYRAKFELELAAKKA